jgi:hypothetical protein
MNGPNTVHELSVSTTFYLLAATCFDLYEHRCIARKWSGIVYRTVVSIWCAIPSGSAVSGVGLRLLACWDRGFQSCREHGCLSVVTVVCCQVEVSALG